MTPDWMSWPETQSLVKAFADAAVPFRFVGGAVRDALLGREVKDVDAATPMAPNAVMALLKKAGIKAIPTGIDHGTVTAVTGKKSFEITTLRRDVSTDGRHAEVAYTDDWKEDAARRDFTINALYLAPSGELFDYFGGDEDLKAGRVRFIGNAEQRIREDYLRILRFFRFYAWYGKGAPDAAALKACETLAGHIEQLSGERIQQEMMKLLAAENPAQSLALMREHAIAPQVFGGDIHEAALTQVKKLEAEIKSPPLPLARLAAIIRHRPNRASDSRAIQKKLDSPRILQGQNSGNDVEWISKRWRMSNHDATLLKAAGEFIPADASLAEQKKILRKTGTEIFIHRIIVSAACHGDAAPYIAMVHLPEKWPPPLFPVSGDDLITLGIQPGKQMGELLKKLEEEWEASDYQLSKKELLARIQ